MSPFPRLLMALMNAGLSISTTLTQISVLTRAWMRTALFGISLRPDGASGRKAIR